MLIYKLNGQDYKSLHELRLALPNVSFPASPSPDALAALGVIVYEVADETPEPTLNESKALKAREIRAASERAILIMREGYTLGEISTFEQQYQGAVEIIANGAPEDMTSISKEARFVVGLAAKRSVVGGVEITPLELAQKIVANYSAAKEYTLHVLGVQQGLETRVYNAETIEEIQNISWPWPIN